MRHTTVGWAGWAEHTEKRLDRMIVSLDRIVTLLQRIEDRLERQDAAADERRRMEWLDGE